MKQHYIVSIETAEDWKVIHELLTQDGTLEDNIPTRACECTDIQNQNNNRATYLLDEDEVNLLKANPKVKYVEIDKNFHPDTEPLTEIQKIALELRKAVDRFISPSKVYAQTRESTDGISPPNFFKHGYAPEAYQEVGVAEKDRVGYNITRLQQSSNSFNYNNAALIEPRPTKASPPYSEFYPEEYTGSWYIQKSIKRPSEIKTQQIQYEYDRDGSDVDIIIADDGVWLGHPEFVNPDGTRQVRDVIIDGPYYIDPAAFAEGNTHGHQTITVMGVTTPTDESAVNWWNDHTKRSAQFQDAGSLTGLSASAFITLTMAAGGTGDFVENEEVVGANTGTKADVVTWNSETRELVVVQRDGGTFEEGEVVSGATASWQVESFYTSKAYNLIGINGSNTAYANRPGDAAHGTSAAGLAYGNTFGHAFNSNKWTIYYAGYDNEATLTQQNFYTALRLFHKLKPINQTHGNKNPTLINFSIQAPTYIFYSGLDWQDFQFKESWSWKWRTSTGFFEGIFDQSDETLSAVPPFLRTSPYLTAYASYGLGLTGSFNAETSLIETAPVKELMEELSQEPGVFVFVCGGNQNQKIVKYSSDPDNDYNNYVSPDGGNTKYYCNRGWFVDLLQDEFNESPIFAIGAIDANKVLDSTFKERVTFFTARGNRIDLYCPGDDNLTAAGNPDINADSGPYFYPRYDGNSTGSTKAYSTLGVNAYDTRFNGTSSACPIAVGWIATLLQKRRTWTPSKVKSYIKNSIPNQSSSTFYYGVESTSGTDRNHYDLYTLEGGDAKVLYNVPVPTISITQQPTSQVIDLGNSVTFQVVATQDENITGTLSYQWEKALSSNPTVFIEIDGANSNQYVFTPSINDSGNLYRCKINGTLGVDETITNTVNLYVNDVQLNTQRFYVYNTSGLVDNGLKYFCQGVLKARLLATQSNTTSNSVTIEVDDVTGITNNMYVHAFPAVNFGERPDGTETEFFSKVQVTNISGTTLTLTGVGGVPALLSALEYNPQKIKNIVFTSTDVNKEVCFKPTDTSPPFAANSAGLTTPFNVALVDNFTSNGGGNLNNNSKVTYSQLEIKHDVNVSANVVAYGSETISDYLPIEDSDGNTFYILLGD